jgi:uncharacterized membrane protein
VSRVEACILEDTSPRGLVSSRYGPFLVMIIIIIIIIIITIMTIIIITTMIVMPSCCKP